MSTRRRPPKATRVHPRTGLLDFLRKEIRANPDIDDAELALQANSRTPTRGADVIAPVSERYVASLARDIRSRAPAAREGLTPEDVARAIRAEREARAAQKARAS